MLVGVTGDCSSAAAAVESETTAVSQANAWRREGGGGLAVFGEPDRATFRVLTVRLGARMNRERRRLSDDAGSGRSGVGRSLSDFGCVG